MRPSAPAKITARATPRRGRMGMIDRAAMGVLNSRPHREQAQLPHWTCVDHKSPVGAELARDEAIRPSKDCRSCNASARAHGNDHWAAMGVLNSRPHREQAQLPHWTCVDHKSPVGAELARDEAISPSEDYRSCNASARALGNDQHGNNWCVDFEAAIASKLTPTLDLRRTQIPCGSRACSR
ncbi:hypothetical protein FBY12_3645 [Pseudomonas sp. SJZ131]|nr:hypothetical protein FBY12_3645 [Pseudomonas sp. SJZ131]